MNKVLMTLLVAMTPVLELRGAIPYGVANGLEIKQIILISIIGNMIPIPFILIFIRNIFGWMKTRSEWLGNVASRLEAKAELKKDKVLRYEFWGLVLLVAIPLPGTGAWTGALVAAILDMQLKRAIPAIFTGVIIAAIIVSLATLGLTSIF